MSGGPKQAHPELWRTRPLPRHDRSWLPHSDPAHAELDAVRMLVNCEMGHLGVVNPRIVGTDSIAERFGVLAELREAGLI